MTDLLATPLKRLGERLSRPVDVASLVAFRVLFGLLLFVSMVRYLASGWLLTQFAQPTFFFRYPGFEWVPHPDPFWLHVEVAALAVFALGIALGFLYRASVVLFLVGFLHLQLLDVTNYLNHYYLVVLLLCLTAVLPLNAAVSLDAWRRPELSRATVPLWVLGLLRFQYGIVYFFAALAKAGPDWLLHGQPLGLWLRSRAELPILGPFFELSWAALAMSWAGFLFDLTIVGFLLWRRSRTFAYIVVLGFHGTTSLLFDIGIFPFLMPIGTTLFFAPDWPRRLLARLGLVWRPSGSVRPIRLPRWVVSVGAAWCLFHVTFPFRHVAYPGNVLWGEEGMRFSWRVMVREKSGSVTYHVRSKTTGREWQVNPGDYLTFRQQREMSTQPDLIRQLAHHVARDFERDHGPVSVRAEAWVSLNGRAPALLVDPDVDLLTAADGPAPRSWILPAPSGPPAARGFVTARLGATP